MATLFVIDSEGRKEFTAKELCDLFGESYDKIIKNPLFKNNKNKRNKKNYLGSAAGSNIIPYFKARHPETGREIEVRYAESWQADKENRNLFKYTPFRVRFYGENFRFDSNPELAVWFALNKAVKKDKAKYEFVDTAKQAKAELDNIDNLEKALFLANKVEDGELAILLKGLSRYFPENVSNVDGMEPVELRAVFRKIAANKPTEFLAKVQQTATAKVEGTILQLVDMGGIVLLPDGPWRIWKWAAGPLAGQAIGDVIRDFSSDTKSILIGEIMSKPEEYKEPLVQALERVNAQAKASDNIGAWSGFDVKSATSAVNDLVDKNDITNRVPEDIGTKSYGVMEIPQATMEAVRGFFDKHNFVKETKDVSSMRKAIEDGIIDADNIEVWCSRNLRTKN